MSAIAKSRSLPSNHDRVFSFRSIKKVAKGTIDDKTNNIKNLSDHSFR